MPKTIYVLLNGIFFILTLFSTIAAVLVHFNTFLFNKYPKPDILTMPLGVLIMLLIFIPFIAMIIMFVSTTNLNDPNNKPISFLPENNQFVMNTIVLCLLYAAFNFFMWLPHDGSPEIIDGKYVLSRKGKILAEITEEEYGKRKVLDVRLFSGHWLIFAIVPMFHFYGNLAQKNNHINNHANN